MQELNYVTKHRLLFVTLLMLSLSSFSTLWYLDSQHVFGKEIKVESEIDLSEDVTGKLLHIPELLATLGSLIKRV